MGKPLIIYCNVPAFKEWPTNFKLLFQALLPYTEIKHCVFYNYHIYLVKHCSYYYTFDVATIQGGHYYLRVFINISTQHAVTIKQGRF